MFFCKGRRADSHPCIISLSDGALHRKPCKMCKNIFHSSCLYRVQYALSRYLVGLPKLIFSVVDQNMSFSDIISKLVEKFRAFSGPADLIWSFAW